MMRREKSLALVLGILAAGHSASAQIPKSSGDDEIHVLPVQGSIYMLVGPGGNITAQAGSDGVLLVDTLPAALAPKIAAELKKLTSKPLRYIIDTSGSPDRVSGNAVLAAMGAPGASPDFGPRATIIAHSNVMNRMTAPVGKQLPPLTDVPNDEYSTPTKDLWFNGEPVIIFHEPQAHSDGDSIVLFRRSDVISAGDIFTPDRYPFIDLARGGSIQGELDALNHLLHLTVPERLQDGGTRVIPGHGRLCNEADVVEYRDMATIIRDRIQDMVKRGLTLEQVKAARPTLDYDTQYGSGEAFIEEVYKSLGGK
jgi:glyoxylase-like metal-dependent hydrolase (beta-lactamase superfamily II)